MRRSFYVCRIVEDDLRDYEIYCMKSDSPCPNDRPNFYGSAIKHEIVSLILCIPHIKSFVFREIIVFTCWIYDRNFRVVEKNKA